MQNLCKLKTKESFLDDSHYCCWHLHSSPMCCIMCKINYLYFPLAFPSPFATCNGNIRPSYATVQATEVTHFQLTVLMWMPHCRSDQRSRQARNSNAFKLLVLLVILDNGPLILDEVFFHIGLIFSCTFSCTLYIKQDINIIVL